MRRFLNALIGLALLPLLLPTSGQGQERVVVSKEIAVGQNEAALRLEFADGGRLALSLRDGSVLVDGETVGSYTAGDGVEAAWRALLGEAVLLDDGPLAEMLRNWSPPAALQGDRMALARRLDGALEGALSVTAAPEPPSPNVSVSVGDERGEALVRVLLGQTARLATLGAALEGLGSDIRLHIDEDVEVAAGETIQGSLVVIQGDARIEGTVDGDVVVVDGTLELLDGGRILGDVRLADAEMERDGGEVEGSVVDLGEGSRGIDAEVRERLRDELRTELRNEIRSATRSEDLGRSFFNPFGRVFRGVGGLVENLVFVFIAGLAGMGVLAFAPRNLEVVAETARRSPGRSAMVGVAGTFLLIPVWVLGAVALAVSIVGIPVMIAWLPLFPLAALAAAILGYLATARNVGEWMADSDLRFTDWIRKSNPLTTLVGGVVGLTVFFMAANVLGILPFFGFFKGLLTFVGVMVSLVAVQIGFGAVLLTRAGRRPEYGMPDFDEAWQRAVDMDVDVDLDVDAAASSGNGGEAGRNRDA